MKREEPRMISRLSDWMLAHFSKMENPGGKVSFESS